MSYPRSAPRRLNAIAFAKIIDAMQTASCTYYELVETSGLSYITVMRYVIAMHKEGVIHITGYEPDSLGRSARAAYALGRGTDAKRSPRSTMERSAERSARRTQARMLGLIA